MILSQLQRELERIYRLGPQPPIARFLVSAEELQGYLPVGTEVRPQVLFQESGGTVRLAVYLGEAALHPQNLADFLSAAEETSHFLYLIWKAKHERPITLLDVEIQGEIDKYLLASAHFPPQEKLFQRLFGKVEFHSSLCGEALARYREAHRLGAKFLKSLGSVFTQKGERPEILRRLREFYRWGSCKRIAQITRA